MTWKLLLKKEGGAVTTNAPNSIKGKLFNISHGKVRRKKHGKEEETEH